MYGSMQDLPAPSAAAGLVYTPNPLRINNVVCTARLAPQIPDMSRLAWLTAGSESRFAHPIGYNSLRCGATVTVQAHSGKLNITGARHEYRALLAVYEYAAMCVRCLGVWDIDIVGFDIHNMQGTFGIGALIDMEALNVKIPRSVYRPHVIKHVQVVLQDPRVSLLVSQYGNVVTNGAKTREDHKRVERDFGQVLLRFARPGATIDAKHRQMVVRTRAEHDVHGEAPGDEVTGTTAAAALLVAKDSIRRGLANGHQTAVTAVHVDAAPAKRRRLMEMSAFRVTDW